MTVVECPTCGKAVPWDDRHPWRPFCSERCKLIDLGDWFEERNRIPDDPHPREHE
ncbi:MAG TPA: DNA gyrase inhibitor YacG [Gammaproteobacteria bacterium]|nr:DNA gyrase inhibitor YacG [Gammaproteobacteria bacterium]